MSFTRDMVQGFIDGYITAGGDPSAVNFALAQYLSNHPIYQASSDEQTAIVGDLATYRVSLQETLAPVAVSLVASKPQAVIAP